MTRRRWPGWTLAGVLAVAGGMVGLPFHLATAATVSAQRGGSPSSAQTPEFDLQRTVLVTSSQIALLDGATVERTIPVATSGPMTLAEVADAIAAPAWISRTGTGVWLLKAALVQGPGTEMVFSSPAVRTLRLESGASVFIGGNHATAVFTGVTVESWDPASAAPEAAPTAGRPFVLYQNSSRLEIDRSTFTRLGSAVNGGAGVTWRNDASGGGAVGSSFTDNFVGADVTSSGVMAFSHDRFDNGTEQGLVVTHGSYRPVLSDDMAVGNGAEGVAVTDGVIGATVVRDLAQRNAASGILLSDTRGRTAVTGVTSTDNALAGIRVHGGSGVSIRGATLDRDKVGLEIEDGAVGTTVTTASIVGNRTGLDARGGLPTTLSGLTVRGSAQGAVLATPAIRLATSTFTADSVGLVVESSAVLTDITVRGATRGIVVLPGRVLQATDAQISARKTGVELGDRAEATIVASTLHAPVPHEGGTVHIRRSVQEEPPVSWPVIIGGTGLLLACFLMELVRYVRERHDPPVLAPERVWNIT